MSRDVLKSKRRAAGWWVMAGLASLSAPSMAGLGAVQVLSSVGQPFEATIAVVDEAPFDAATVALADRNHYALISPYSHSVGKLVFTLQRRADGTISGVHISGPAGFDEERLRFAVELDWSAGRLVREYEVDYRRDGPRRAPSAPSHDESGKKPVPNGSNPLNGHLVLGDMQVKSRPAEPFLAEIEVAGTALAVNRDSRLKLIPSVDGGVTAQAVAAKIAALSVERLPSAEGRQRWQLRSESPLDVPLIAFSAKVSVGEHETVRNYVLVNKDGSWSKPGVAAAGQYQVKAGDTLSQIAGRFGARSRLRTMARLVELNPEAFVGGDPDRLLAGVVLNYPGSWKLTGDSAQPAAPAAQPETATAKPVQAAPVAAAVPPVKPARNEADQLKARLANQDALLREAEQRSRALESRMRDLAEASRAKAMASAATAVAPASAATAVPKVEPAVEAPTSPLDSSALLAYGAAGVAVLAGGAVLMRSRRQRDTATTDSAAAATEPPTQGGVAAGPVDEPLVSDDFAQAVPEMPLVLDDPAFSEMVDVMPPAARVEETDGPLDMPDKLELARLYREMGDTETAEALMKEMGVTSL